MKAIKKLYADRSTANSHLQYNNQENRFNQSNSSFGENSYRKENIYNGLLESKRKRKFNDMSCDMDISSGFEENRQIDSKTSMSICGSPTTSNNNIHIDEEDKEASCAENEDLAKYYSVKLLEVLKNTRSDAEALENIHDCLLEYKSKSTTQPKIQAPEVAKQKYSDKDKKIFVDTFKKLASDNVLLKSSIRKLVEKTEKNKYKVEKFDSLVIEYERVSNENKKLKNSIDILKYAAQDKCQDISYQGYPFGKGNGGAGVF